MRERDAMRAVVNAAKGVARAWWTEDQYGRCQSRPENAIRDLRSALDALTKEEG